MKQEYIDYTATSSDDSIYNRSKKQGYEEGKKRAIKEFNERLMTWLMIGVFVGFVIGFLVDQSFWLFASIIGLIYLTEKINEIKHKQGL